VRPIFILLTIFSFSCHHQADDERISTDTAPLPVEPRLPSTTFSRGPDSFYVEGYPRIIDSLKVKALFDEAKWRMYCMHCADTYNWSDSCSSLFSGYFGFLPLKFCEISIVGDSSELYFEIPWSYDERKCCCKSDLLFEGVGYSGGKNGRYYYIGDNVREYDSVRGLGDPFIFQHQRKAARFIRKYKDRLDPWFREMAIKRGILPSP
jgi:hypothetical protein